MIKLLYKGTNYTIGNTVIKANEILQNNAFYEKIANLPQMSNTDLSSREIASILKENMQEIEVESFWNPFGKPTKSNQSYGFKVNSYNFSCSTSYAVNKIINETLLSLALKCDALHFQEANAEDNAFENIFPCRIGQVAEILTRKNKMSLLKTQFT